MTKVVKIDRKGTRHVELENGVAFDEPSLWNHRKLDVGHIEPMPHDVEGKHRLTGRPEIGTCDGCEHDKRVGRSHYCAYARSLGLESRLKIADPGCTLNKTTEAP